MIPLEICVDSVESALIAEKNGAARVELCGGLLYEGGTTPSYGTIRLCKQKLKIPVMVMIRPRGGDFCYSDFEYEVMKEDIKIAKSVGCDGVVFGILKPDGTVDVDRTKELVQLAKPMLVTFHRAFDMTQDPVQAFHSLVQIDGIDRILSSGQSPTVLEGLPTLTELQSIAESASRPIIILPGGGITLKTLPRIIKEMHPKEVHMYAGHWIESGMKFRNEDVYMGGVLARPPEYSNALTDSKLVRAVLNVLN
ncbi:copper homeostasis CutC domain-containing protein [Paraphysoderma sedebokerense]|nr:copper homeostasis CutC domain-containing protein [Paraphysoderma sedebokerense]